MMTQARHPALLNLAALAAIVTALILVSVKYYGYQSTGSAAILASLLDSVLDVFTSVVNFIAIRVALKPPDNEHRFGHGKAEALAGLGQSVIIALSASLLLYQAVQNLQQDRAILELTTGLYIMLFSLAATLALVSLQQYAYRKTASLAIKADSVHYLSDLLSNGLVILGLGLAYLGLNWVDPVIACLIGLYILYSAWQILQQSIDVLLDRELDEAVVQQIREIVLSDPEIHAIHEMKTRAAAHSQYIQLHIEMDAQLSLRAAHDISRRAKLRLVETFPQADIIIHMDPENDAVEGAERHISE